MKIQKFEKINQQIIFFNHSQAHQTIKSRKLKHRVLKNGHSLHKAQQVLKQQFNVNEKDRINLVQTQPKDQSRNLSRLALQIQLKRNNWTQFQKRNQKLFPKKTFQQAKLTDSKQFLQKMSLAHTSVNFNRKQKLQVRLRIMKHSPYISKPSDLNKIIKMLKPVKGPSQSVKNQIYQHNDMNKKNHQAVLLRNNHHIFQIKRQKYLIRIGLKPTDKVFIINSRDQHIKKTLKQRGWIQLDDKFSTFFHLKWVYSDYANDYAALSNGQFFNHFHNNQQLTNKNDLRKNVKLLQNHNKPRMPLTFDLGISQQYKQFYQNCLFFQALKLLNLIKNSMKKYEPTKYERIMKNKNFFNHFNFNSQLSHDDKSEYVKDPKKIKQLYFKNNQKCVVIQNILELMSFLINILHKKSKINYSILNINQKDIKIFQILSYIEAQLKNEKYILSEGSSFMKVQVLKLVQHFQNIKSQFQASYGTQNVWIVKPTGVSRGSGIYIQQDYKKLLSQNNSQHGKIIQKYLERPLLLKDGRKFDLRQWILVKSFQPLEAYAFHKCYGRICPQKYENSDWQNMQKHLTNYSLSKDFYRKKNKSTKMLQFNEQSIVFSHVNLRKTSKPSIILEQDLQQYIQSLKGKSYKWNDIKSQMNESIIKILKGCSHNITQNVNCFEVYGFDIILDHNCKPFVLEVNLSPACQDRQGLDLYLRQMSHGIIQFIQINAHLHTSFQHNIFNEVWLKLDQDKISREIEQINYRKLIIQKVRIIQKFFRLRVLSKRKTKK